MNPVALVPKEFTSYRVCLGHSNSFPTYRTSKKNVGLLFLVSLCARSKPTINWFPCAKRNPEWLDVAFLVFGRFFYYYYYYSCFVCCLYLKEHNNNSSNKNNNSNNKNKNNNKHRLPGTAAVEVVRLFNQVLGSGAEVEVFWEQNLARGSTRASMAKKAAGGFGRGGRTPHEERLWLSKAFWDPILGFSVRSPPIVEPTFVVGLGCFGLGCSLGVRFGF